MTKENYHGPERRKHACPVDNCGEIILLTEENEKLNARIKNVGIVSLTILTIVCTVILAMSKYTLDTSRESNNQLASFINDHTKTLLRDEGIHSRLVTQMEEQQRQSLALTVVQSRLVEKVAAMDAREKKH